MEKFGIPLNNAYDFRQQLLIRLKVSNLVINFIDKSNQCKINVFKIFGKESEGQHNVKVQFTLGRQTFSLSNACVMLNTRYVTFHHQA